MTSDGSAVRLEFARQTPRRPVGIRMTAPPSDEATRRRGLVASGSSEPCRFGILGAC